MPKEPCFLIIGDFMIDHYVYGAVERLSPEAPVPILEEEKESIFPGGAGMVVSNLRSLGTQVEFLSVVGDDEEGKNALGMMTKMNLPKDNILIENGRRTTVKKRFVATRPFFQNLLRLDYETKEDIDNSNEEKIIRKLNLLIPKCDLIIVPDYNKGVLTKKIISMILNLAKKHGKRIIVDTKKNLYHYTGVDFIVPNAKELCLTYGIRPTNEDGPIHEMALKLSDALETQVVVKRSARGATIVQKGKVIDVPGRATKVVNVSGAGDIFVAVFSLAIAKGRSTREAVEIANIACSKAIARERPHITPEDLKGLL
ncbi:bifunctional hydroxymethylpyrimidine kinase/phosphomethylpyrimidine kinase [Candidatus Micrarchaeota archaeon]|nr:bifunctional hydroxymethylpyrimidine kinase/phosphomethylpyrimidine kinase [Candidatus Micrarchaeota archaeon]